MFDSLFSMIAPHSCCSCGEVGAVLCEDCKNNIISEPYARCIFCDTHSALGALCRNCGEDIANVWVLGKREGGIKKLVDAMKFFHTPEACVAAAECLDALLPVLPSETVVTWVPTSQKHIRERGYDQSRRVAERFARLRGLPSAQLAYKITNKQMRGLSKKERQQAVKGMFLLREHFPVPATLLLIDDVITTGTSLSCLAGLFQERGVERILCAAVAKQSNL